MKSQETLPSLLDGLASYMSNKYEPAFEEPMRLLISKIRRSARGQNAVVEMADAAETYLEAAVNYARNMAQTYRYSTDKETEQLANMELLQLTRRKRQCYGDWAQLWSIYHSYTAVPLEVVMAQAALAY